MAAVGLLRVAPANDRRSAQPAFSPAQPPGASRELHDIFQVTTWKKCAHTDRRQYKESSGAPIAPSRPGEVADQLGRRRLFLVGVTVFGIGIGSMLCAMAPGLGLLVAGRVIQGIGGALLTPASLGQPNPRSRAFPKPRVQHRQPVRHRLLRRLRRFRTQQRPFPPSGLGLHRAPRRAPQRTRTAHGCVAGTKVGTARWSLRLPAVRDLRAGYRRCECDGPPAADRPNTTTVAVRGDRGSPSTREALLAAHHRGYVYVAIMALLAAVIGLSQPKRAIAKAAQ